jgi:tetratricopeptide (TPR) repeat protein
MKEAGSYELMDVFMELEKENQMDIGFYFEMANFFFEKGNPDKAQELMYNAIELCQGSSEGLKLAAYMYENWKWFSKAIAVYKGILSQDENNVTVKRDLALAYFQNKNFEAAVKTYYSIITAEHDYYSMNITENALAEMNAILVLHKNEFDVSYINQNLIRSLPIELRITLESNHDFTGKVQFIEPGNTVCDSRNPNTVNGGRFTGNEYYGYNYNYDYNFNEYTVKQAAAGRYRVKINSYDSYSQIPMYVRVITFKNFNKENMEMEVKIFDLDNQYGVIELDEINW